MKKVTVHSISLPDRQNANYAEYRCKLTYNINHAHD
jgi:hypothetical protein